MANRELMCLECGHTFEVYTASDDDEEELEAECPVCGSVDTTRTYDEDTEVDEEIGRASCRERVYVTV